MTSQLIQTSPEIENLSLQSLDSKSVWVFDSIVVLTMGIIPKAALARRPNSIASDLGRSAIDTGVDSPPFSGPFWWAEVVGVHRELRAKCGLQQWGTPYFRDATGMEMTTRRDKTHETRPVGVRGTITCPIL